MNRTFVLGPAKLAIGDGTMRRGRVVVQHGRIAEILEGEGPSDIAVPPDAIIAPGLIDVHTNGAGDLHFNRDQGAAVEAASRSYAMCGAAGFVAAIMTAPWESMMHAAAEVAEAAHDLVERPEPIGARCLGVHFEGPFLNPKYRRVHRLDWLMPASHDRVAEMMAAANGTLVMVTMAPEADGVADAARTLAKAGIVCSAGHTSAHYRDGMLAIGIGFRTVTHAFNGMPALDHRDPSILAAFMQEPRTTIQVIADGYHVAPVMVDLLYRTVGERLVLATDYMPPTGSGYKIVGGVMRAEDGTIAGSALRIDQALRNLMQYAALPFERAIVCASAAPAKLLGIDADMGTIAPGRRADLSVWNERYDAIATLVDGVIVHGAAHLEPSTART